MKIYNISKSQFSKLQELELTMGIPNTQGELFHLPTDANEVRLLFKRTLIQDNEYFQNKVETLVALMEQEREKAFPHLVYPNGLVTIDHDLQGFSMPFIEGTNLKIVLKDPRISLDEKKGFLKQVGALLEEMRKYRQTGLFSDFYLNDIHEGNFIVEAKTGIVKYVDLDSAAIAGLNEDRAMYLKPLSKFSDYQEKYPVCHTGFYGPHLVPSNDTEIYSFAMIILNFIAKSNLGALTPEQLTNYLYYLQDLGYPNEVIECLLKLYSKEPNENPLEIVDSIIKFSRAPFEVYLNAFY